MISIETLSEKLAKNLKEELKLEEDKYEVVKYGLFSFIYILTSIVLVALIGGIFGVLIEALFISFTISLLRKSSGGGHSNSEFNCTIIGIVISVVPAVIINNFQYERKFLYILGAIIFSISFFIAYKLAPVDSPNKPIRTPKKIKRLRKQTFIILGSYSILSIFFIIISNHINIVDINNLVMCLYIGTIWQIFTLTKLGHNFIYIIDYFLKNLRSEENEKTK